VFFLVEDFSVLLVRVFRIRGGKMDGFDEYGFGS